MSPEKFSRNFKLITTEEGARKIFFITKVDLNPEEYLDKAIEAFKKLISRNVRGVSFTFFLSENKPYVLIIDTEGNNYRYDPENNVIYNSENNPITPEEKE